MNAVSPITAIQTLSRDLLQKSHQLLIGGKWTAAASGRTFPVQNPANGKVIAHVAEGDRVDVDAAVAAAREAFDAGPWTRLPPSERARLMWKLSDLLERDADELALIEVLDNGKPLRFARYGDVAGAVETLRYYAGWPTKLNGETMPMSCPGDWHAYTTREPIGVAGLIVAWNFPLAMAVAKLAPALAAGCTVVMKPSELTPLSTIRLGELVQEAGFPDGVVNIVTGFGATAGAAIAEHPGVDKISFTGSTAVGKSILRAAAGNLKRLTLELGGKSPVIIFPDADLERAASGAADGIFWNSGQVCAANSRLFAHQKIFDQLMDSMSRHAEGLKLGAGVEPDTDLGPLVSQVQLDRVTGYVQAGVKDGATVVTGGSRAGEQGYFMQPTILANTSAQMSVVREEIFGPVLCATSFADADLDRIAALANDTSYGLSARVWTRDVGTAHKMARKIKAGQVCVNGLAYGPNLPFGGYKQSGWGRENGRDGVEAFTELKSVTIGL
jgi:phenylacetaldehyde dehydrogenase